MAEYNDGVHSIIFGKGAAKKMTKKYAVITLIFQSRNGDAFFYPVEVQITEELADHMIIGCRVLMDIGCSLDSCNVGLKVTRSGGFDKCDYTLLDGNGEFLMEWMDGSEDSRTN